jgi:hypothetical protein
VDHPLEREADRVAEAVVAGRLVGAISSANSATPQRKCAECEEENERTFQRKETGQGSVTSQAIDVAAKAVSHGGNPLTPEQRAYFEPRFARALSHVRIHTDQSAAAAARGINARAFTLGSHVAITADVGKQGGGDGQRLLAHELAHVVQQSGEEGHAPQLIQRSPGPPEETPMFTSMFIDPYPNLSIPQLKKLARTDPEAAESLRLRYRNMSNTPGGRAKLNRLAARGDAMAKSVRNQRIPENQPLKKLGERFAPFSDLEMYGELAADLQAARVQSGIRRTGPSAVLPEMEVEGGTMGAARADVPGLGDKSFIGRSPKAGGEVNPLSEFPPATDPEILPQTHGHAEQDLADQLAAALRDLPPENLEMGRVSILIEQEPCSTCAAGIVDPEVSAGPLRKLSEAFPKLTFEIKHLDSNKIIRLRDGKEVPAPSPIKAYKAPPAMPKPMAPMKAYEGAPMEAFKGSPMEAYKGSPMEAFKGSPMEAFKGSPMEAFKGSPMEAFERRIGTGGAFQ